MEKTDREKAVEVMRVLDPKDANDMTIEEFKELPLRGWDEDIGEFTSLVILPTEDLHDSEYRCMDFVAVRNGKPVCRMSGCSDVIHLGGIGGSVLRRNQIVDWNIDCLKVSGLLHIFCHRPITAGAALSSFEIYAKEKVDK